MSTHSAPTQPGVVAEREATGHHECATGTDAGPRPDAAVAMADVIVAPGSGRAWHTHPAPASHISLEGDVAFLAGHGRHVRVVTIPAGASIHIPAELPHAYTNTGHRRGRLFVALATDLASSSAQSDLRTAGPVSASEGSPRAWRRALAYQYHLAETRLLASRDPICCACGVAARTKGDLPYVRQQDAWFCADCWRRLSAAEIDGAVQGVALRGVPLS